MKSTDKDMKFVDMFGNEYTLKDIVKMTIASEKTGKEYAGDIIMDLTLDALNELKAIIENQELKLTKWIKDTILEYIEAAKNCLMEVEC